MGAIVTVQIAVLELVGREFWTSPEGSLAELLGSISNRSWRILWIIFLDLTGDLNECDRHFMCSEQLIVTHILPRIAKGCI
jgi:hypothetical protein